MLSEVELWSPHSSLVAYGEETGHPGSGKTEEKDEPEQGDTHSLGPAVEVQLTRSFSTSKEFRNDCETMSLHRQVTPKVCWSDGKKCNLPNSD
jgi:hypothetical protein